MSTVSNGIYFIRNASTDVAMDLQDGSANVQGYQKRELSDPLAPAQLWIVIVQSGTGTDSVYTIENAKGATFLELPNGNTQDATRLVCQASSGQQTQRWTITRNTGNTGYIITNQASGTNVDLLYGGTANGTAINGWGAHGIAQTNPHQLWNFVRA